MNPALLHLCVFKLDEEKLEKIPILKKLRDAEEQAGKDVTLGASPAVPEPSTQGGRAKRQSRRRPNTRADPEREPKPDNKAEPPEPKARQRPSRARKESRGDEGAAKEGETRERGKERRRRRGAASEKGPEEGGEGGDAAATVAAPRKLPPTVTTVYLGGIPAGLRVSELKSALRERDAAPLRLTWQGAQHRAFLDYSDPPTAEQALAALQDLSVNGHSLQAELAKSQRGGGKRAGQSSRRPRPTPAKGKVPPEVKGDASEVTE